MINKIYPRLSICIPTLNRPLDVQRTVTDLVETIIESMIPYSVQIVVSFNNLSGINEGIKIGENIELKKLYDEKLLRFTENLNKSLANSDGDYVWIMPDDDFIDKKSLAHFLKHVLFSKNDVGKGLLYGFNLSNLVDEVGDVNITREIFFNYFAKRYRLPYYLLSSYIFKINRNVFADNKYKELIHDDNYFIQNYILYFSIEAGVDLIALTDGVIRYNLIGKSRWSHVHAYKSLIAIIDLCIGNSNLAVLIKREVYSAHQIIVIQSLLKRAHIPDLDESIIYFKDFSYVGIKSLMLSFSLKIIHILSSCIKRWAMII